MNQAAWADRGRMLRIGSSGERSAQCVGVSRLGTVVSSGGEQSIWLQARGGAWVHANEGRFYLRKGSWVAFAKDSNPTIQADQGGICLGLTVADDAIEAMRHFSDFALYIGRGQLDEGELHALIRHWYRAFRHFSSEGDAGRVEGPLRSLLLRLERIQGECQARSQQCPGGSLSRKRQVFERLQRARLYMEGHCHRIIQTGELAERTQFSTWYFSKLFHRIYGETAQQASARMRLRHATALLASTSMAITEVSAACGFENPCSFARSFRAGIGMTASDFRKHSAGIGQTKYISGLFGANKISGQRTAAVLGGARRDGHSSA